MHVTINSTVSVEKNDQYAVYNNDVTTERLDNVYTVPTSFRDTLLGHNLTVMEALLR